ncbi:11271_t:CDS:1, partial [Dentiscutata heterogama]
MEYNIYSNDDSINEIIFSALKDLDDTFFVEPLGSEDEKEESDSLSDIEPTSDVDDEIPSSKLNEFVFEDIPDNYIEDKIYDDLKLE